MERKRGGGGRGGRGGGGGGSRAGLGFDQQVPPLPTPLLPSGPTPNGATNPNVTHTVSRGPINPTDRGFQGGGRGGGGGGGGRGRGGSANAYSALAVQDDLDQDHPDQLHSSISPPPPPSLPPPPPSPLPPSSVVLSEIVPAVDLDEPLEPEVLVEGQEGEGEVEEEVRGARKNGGPTMMTKVSLNMKLSTAEVPSLPTD